ncbi:MAG: hypothetical protein U0Q03_00955 [Acidimicrobiales bacterium]
MEFVPVVIGIVVCGAAVWAALKLRPSKQRSLADKALDARIDPFGVGEPWRHHVAGAQSAQRRYLKIVAGMHEGPLRSRMADIGRQVDRGVAECWAIAKHGDQLDDTIRGLDASGVQARYDRAADDATRDSLRRQLDAVQRIREARAQTDSRLAALQARLGELVSQAAEVSIGSDITDELGSAVDDVVVQLQALSQAVDEVNTTGRSRAFETGPGTASPAT